MLNLQSLPKTFEPIEQKQTFLVILDSLENIVPPPPYSMLLHIYNLQGIGKSIRGVIHFYYQQH